MRHRPNPVQVLLGWLLASAVTSCSPTDAAGVSPEGSSPPEQTPGPADSNPAETDPGAESSAAPPAVSPSNPNPTPEPTPPAASETDAESSAPTASPTPPGNPSPPANPEPPSNPPTSGTSVIHPDGSSIKPGSGPLGVETTCDGKDDDANGVIDDVDQTADGVCDCLRVATLGLHGEWGDGNVVTGWFKDHFTQAVDDLDGEPLSEERLAPYQVLLVRDVSPNHNASLSFSAAEVTALWNWVRDGGGLMTVIGYSDAGEASNVNRLLEPFALSYGDDQIVQGQGASVPVTEWFEHPLTTGITQVGADNGYPAVGQGVTIAAEGGFDVGKAAVIGDGHVLVWGDEWITYQGEWQGNTSNQVEQFWKNTLLWLARVNECQVPKQ